MDRREALKVLMTLPATARISAAALKPEDVIVMESDEYLTIRTKEQIADTLKRVWPSHRCIVLDRGLHLKLVDGRGQTNG